MSWRENAPWEHHMHSLRRLIHVVFLTFASHALGEAPDEVSADVPAEVIDEAAASEWMTEMSRHFLPLDYEDTRHWGKTKRVWDGLHVRREGLEIKTHRRWKDANHGTWTKYSVRAIDPQEKLQVTVANIRRLENG